MTAVAIPKRLQHIWIGPKPAPVEWMQSWPAAHPDWDYGVFDNRALSARRFRTQHLIDRYMDLGLYAGAADLVRYELLYEEGGYQAAADSICLRPMDPLLTRATAYTVYENERLRGSLVSPIVACEPGNAFVGKLVDELTQLSPEELGEPWITTGNMFVTDMIARHDPDIVIWPSHTLIPVHYTGDVYRGDAPIHGLQMFGATRNAYAVEKDDRRPGWFERIRRRKANKRRRRALRQFKATEAARANERFQRSAQKVLDAHGVREFANSQE